MDDSIIMQMKKKVVDLLSKQIIPDDLIFDCKLLSPIEWYFEQPLNWKNNPDRLPRERYKEFNERFLLSHAKLDKLLGSGSFFII